MNGKEYILYLSNNKGAIASIDLNGTVEINQSGEAPELAKILYEAIANEGVGLVSTIEKLRSDLEAAKAENVTLNRMVEAMASRIEYLTSRALTPFEPKDEVIIKYRAEAEKRDALEAKKTDSISLQQLIDAVNEHCTCGGAGPGEGCPACEVYHALVGNRIIL